jgi:hypothetical protein
VCNVSWWSTRKRQRSASEGTLQSKTADEERKRRRLITLSAAAAETGYSSRQIRRWLRDGKIQNLGTETRPLVRRIDVLSHKKNPILPTRPVLSTVPSAQDVARSVVNSKRRNDG